ncbi:uncharacterized protein LOC135290863 [Passer domesticus]|uniref:uncharacterized protein LOC135290863 n=1 Tax=Passer domesticus TaxID=48849 RepID=UPI0030FE2000
MDQECKYPTAEELCPLEDVCRRELCLWDEVSVQEVHRWEEEDTFQEMSPCGAMTQQKVRHWQVGATVQWPDGTQQELSRCGERVTMQDLDDEDDDRCQELCLWEEEVAGPRVCPWANCAAVQEPFQWDCEDDTCPELSPCCALSPCCPLSPCRGLSPCSELPPCRGGSPSCVLSPCRGMSPVPELFSVLRPVDEKEVAVHFCQRGKDKKEGDEEGTEGKDASTQEKNKEAQPGSASTKGNAGASSGKAPGEGDPSPDSAEPRDAGAQEASQG